MPLLLYPQQNKCFMSAKPGWHFQNSILKRKMGGRLVWYETGRKNAIVIFSHIKHAPFPQKTTAGKWSVDYTCKKNREQVLPIIEETNSRICSDQQGPEP